MMTRIDNVNMILESMEQVKKQAKEALDKKDTFKFNELMGNVMALHTCLEAETKKLLEEIDQAA